MNERQTLWALGWAVGLVVLSTFVLNAIALASI